MMMMQPQPAATSSSCRYDVLVIDLDGTLLDHDGGVSRRNRNAIERAWESGLEVIIATGRSLSESRHALTALEHDGLLIAAGGSLLCDCATGATLDRDALSREVVIEVTSALLEHELRVLVLKDAHATGYDYLLVGGAELDPASRWWFGSLPVELRHAQHIDHDEHPEHSLRVGAVAGSAKLEPLAERLRISLGERAFLQHWSAVTESHATGSTTHLLEVFHHHVDKWTMVQRYCRTRGGEKQETGDRGQAKGAASGPARVACDASPDVRVRVAAIGDGLNDVRIVREADLGIAMGNADPRVLAVADRVTGHHQQDGVADAIEAILAGLW